MSQWLTSLDGETLRHLGTHVLMSRTLALTRSWKKGTEATDHSCLSCQSPLRTASTYLGTAFQREEAWQCLPAVSSQGPSDHPEEGAPASLPHQALPAQAHSSHPGSSG